MYVKGAFCLIFLVFGWCEAKPVQSFEKCSITDAECQKRVLVDVFQSHSKSLHPDLVGPSVDPYIIKDQTISILNLVDMTMVDGEMDGLSKCEITKYEINIKKKFTISEVYCDSVTMKGHYKVESSPLIASITGNTLSGDGNGQIKIDKMLLKLRMPFSIERHEDGKIYIVPQVNRADYSTEVTDKITFEADNFIVNNEEVSKQVTTFMNKHWRLINKSFGKFFTDEIMREFYGQLKKFFTSLPAKEYITDDLSPYIEK